MLDVFKDAVLRLLAAGPMSGATLGQSLLRDCPDAFRAAKAEFGTLAGALARVAPVEVERRGSGTTSEFAIRGAPSAVSPEAVLAEPTDLEEAYRTLLSPGTSFHVLVERSTGKVLSAPADAEVDRTRFAVVAPLSEAQLLDALNKFLGALQDTQLSSELRALAESHRWSDLRRRVGQAPKGGAFSEHRRDAVRAHVTAQLAAAGVSEDTAARVASAIAEARRTVTRERLSATRAVPPARNVEAQGTSYSMLFQYAAEHMDDDAIRRFVLPLCGLLLDRSGR